MTRLPKHLRKKISRLYADARKTDAAIQARPLTGAQADNISVLHWICFRAITDDGVATEENWSNLAQAVNMSLLLAEKGIGAEHMCLTFDAQEALMRAAKRGKATGRWGFDGDGIRAVQQALELHDEQIKVASKAELLEALHTLRKRVDSGVVLEEAA